MAFKSDIEIAREAKMLPVTEIARDLGIEEEDLDCYGRYKAKLNAGLWEKIKNKEDGKLILVTAINPTPAGEGKTTTCVGLGEAMGRLGKKAIITLREPSLGPCMGVKGGAAGGGYAQVVPMEDINLHFTGDLHAISTAHNLLAAMIDNHLQQGNELGIDPRTITWKRVVDLNDRSLRQVIVGLGGKSQGVPRESGYMITVASEVMAILCLSKDLMDLKERISRILIGYTYQGKPVFAGDLKAQGAMTALLRDAFNPNLVQTLENTPAIIHGGPFANIAHGCNSLRATRYALKLADYVITETGFGADLGAEKFFDIKCRLGGLKPDASVLVATIRALKYNGGVKKEDTAKPDLAAVKKGIVNLEAQIQNLQLFGVPVVVTLNAFLTDSPEEITFVEDKCRQMGCEFALSHVWEKGGEGGIDLANALIRTLETTPSDYHVLYPDEMSLEDKIRTIAEKVYGADGVIFGAGTKTALKKYTELGYGKFPVCMAKTQYSLSDNPKKLGRPKGFQITIRQVDVSAGAGFIVAIAGDIMTMPGLPKVPAAEWIDIDQDGNITGLF
ncbi:MAG: formate--tetrahydrofolate ligase [Firmicutes bacterium]|nr:formate--tetrahydrofolate ligase [Bacillota bacterium]